MCCGEPAAQENAFRGLHANEILLPTSGRLANVLALQTGVGYESRSRGAASKRSASWAKIGRAVECSAKQKNGRARDMISEFPGRSRQVVLRRNLRAMNADGFSFSVMVGIAETYLPAFMLSRGFGEFAAASSRRSLCSLEACFNSAPGTSPPAGFIPSLCRHDGVPAGTQCVHADAAGVLSWAAGVDGVYPGNNLLGRRTFHGTCVEFVGRATGSNVHSQRLFCSSQPTVSRGCAAGTCRGRTVAALVRDESVRLANFCRVVRHWCPWSPDFLANAGAANGDCPSRCGHDCGRRRFRAICGNQSGHLEPTPDAAGSRPAGGLSGARSGCRACFRAVLQPVHAPRHAVVVDRLHEPALARIHRQDVVFAVSSSLRQSFCADRLLWAGSLGIVPISALWFCSQQFWFLAGIQILSGLVWGWYELAMLLQFFRRIPAERRVFVLTVYNVGNSAAMVVGTVIGAFVLQGLARTADAYLTVFLLSGCLRACCLLALPDRRQAVATTMNAVHSVQRKVQGRAARVHAGGRSIGGLHHGPVVAAAAAAAAESAFAGETHA